MRARKGESGDSGLLAFFLVFLGLAVICRASSEPLFVKSPTRAPQGTIASVTSTPDEVLALASQALEDKKPDWADGEAEALQSCWAVQHDFPQRVCVFKQNQCTVQGISQASSCLFCERGEPVVAVFFSWIHPRVECA
jgi:hypothetical protein